MAKAFVPDTNRAASAVNETLASLAALQWAVRAADEHGRDGMVAVNQLMTDILPIAGGKLEAAYLALDGTKVGLFPLQAEGDHGRN